VTGTYTSLPRGNANRSDVQISSSFRAVFEHWRDLAARPATDEQLAKIWPPWNALPPDMMPELKLRILKLDESSRYELDPERLAALQNLRRQFPNLPLDRNEFNQALNQVQRWASLSRFFQTTVTLHEALVTRQWAFAEADADASGRIAIYRAVQEIDLTHPGLFKSTSPKLADIAYLDSRYIAYSNARAEALAALADILYKVPGMRTGKRLPLDEVALGVPNPPDDVPRHLYIARLDALGICTRERLEAFLRDELPKFSPEKKRQFDNMRLRPHYGKEPYAALLVWLLENRPIFEHKQFAWQWGDIQSAAAEKGINCPSTSLKQWACLNRLRLRVKRGPTTVDDSRIVRSKPLLSPAPVFGDVLKSATA